MGEVDYSAVAYNTGGGDKETKKKRNQSKNKKHNVTNEKKGKKVYLKKINDMR